MKPAGYYREREQTYLKHFFLERYLETVAFHIAYTHREFVYVDCFSGPWKSADEDLADTSIRIALDKLNYVRDALAARRRHAAIRAIFIEKDPAAFSALQRAVRQNRRSITATTLPGAFEENIPAILREVGQTFAFFFIDPKGWTGFAMDNIRPILRHQPGEVMVNFMYDFINRFVNYPNPANEASLDRFFGATGWRDIRNATDRETASLDCYKEQLRTTGSYTYVTSTRILKPLHDRAYFHLVYGTRNPRGILKFREVEKQAVREQDMVREAARREHREQRTGQAELPFEPTADLSENKQTERAQRLREAQSRLFTLLQQRAMPYETLQPLILEIPLVWNTDLNAILMKARKDGQVEIDGFAPRQKVPKAGNIIRAQIRGPKRLN